MILLFIHAKAAQSVGVGEFAEALKLFGAGRRVELVRDFEKCHAGIIPALASNAAVVRKAYSMEPTVHSKAPLRRHLEPARFAGEACLMQAGICFPVA